MKSLLVVGALVMAGLMIQSAPVRAVLASKENPGPQEAAGVNAAPLQARLYRLPRSRVLGQVSVHQGATVLEITAGEWNGQSLQGLALVLVNNSLEKSTAHAVTRCYVSHAATEAQRAALLDAYLTSQALPPDDRASWRVEPAVIRLEKVGSVVVVRLGLVA
jgi:hypothetical protein